MDLENMTQEQLDQLLEELVNAKSERAKVHRAEVIAEVRKRATYKMVDKPLIKGRELKNKLASAKREREKARKSRVREMSRIETEKKAERARKRAEAEAEAQAEAERKAAEKTAKKAEKAAQSVEVIEVTKNNDEQPM